MYEPKYLPHLRKLPTALVNMHFAAIHRIEHRQSNDPNADPLHIHQALEIFLNLSGDVSFTINNDLYDVPVGSAVVSRASDIHMGIFRESAMSEYICIWIEADFNDPMLAFLRQADFCPLFSFDEQEKSQMQHLALALSEVGERSDAALEQTSYLIRILRILEKNTHGGAAQACVPTAFQKILDDIHTHFSEIRSVNDILKRHFVSSATLTRQFRKYLHSSPREYLEQVRLSNAALSLTSGSSVTDACMRAGFSDCSHFIVLFKKRFGATPLQYKKAVETEPLL